MVSLNQESMSGNSTRVGSSGLFKLVILESLFKNIFTNDVVPVHQTKPDHHKNPDCSSLTTNALPRHPGDMFLYKRIILQFLKRIQPFTQMHFIIELVQSTMTLAADSYRAL